MFFQSREQAAQLLAHKLEKYSKQNPAVLAVPRGAVPMGRIIADHLDAPLDVVLVHKIGAPDNPELAIGSVTEYGDVMLNEVAAYYGLSGPEIDNLAQKEVLQLKERHEAYRRYLRPSDLTGKTVIIVDDGIATGATVLAAIRSVRRQNPSKTVIATAVAPPETVARLREDCDEVEVLYVPDRLYGVGLYFDDFSQVTDDEVKEILAGQRTRYAPKASERDMSAQERI